MRPLAEFPHHLRARVRHDIGDGFNLFLALDAARSRHGHHMRTPYLHLADLNHRSLRIKILADQFVWRNDAMAFLHAVHRLEIRRIEIVDGPDASQHCMRDTGGPVNGESHAYQAVDYGLNGEVRRPLLHYH